MAGIHFNKSEFIIKIGSTEFHPKNWNNSEKTEELVTLYTESTLQQCLISMLRGNFSFAVFEITVSPSAEDV